MGNPWDVKATEWVGKLIPNEVSKLNSWSKWLEKIPIVGQALSVVVKGISALDSGPTAYADTYKDPRLRNKSEGERRQIGIGRAVGSVMGSIQGESIDPGRYGSQGDINRDWANIAGQIGNYMPSYSSSSSTGSTGGSKGGFSAGGMGGLMNLKSNPYFFDQDEKTDTASTGAGTGTGTSGSQNPLASLFGGGGQTAGQGGAGFSDRLTNILNQTSILKAFLDEGDKVEEDEETEDKKSALKKVVNSVLAKNVEQQVSKETDAIINASLNNRNYDILNKAIYGPQVFQRQMQPVGGLNSFAGGF